MYEKLSVFNKLTTRLESKNTLSFFKHNHFGDLISMEIRIESGFLMTFYHIHHTQHTHHKTNSPQSIFYTRLQSSDRCKIRNLILIVIIRSTSEKSTLFTNLTTNTRAH
jgi:hypothetical protein